MKILLAVDDSKFSEAAVQAVAAQARPENDEVRVLSVVDVMDNPFPEMTKFYAGVEHAPCPQGEPTKALVDKTAELLGAKGLSVSTAMVWGNPESKIIDAATDWAADLIVVGAHGRKGLKRFLMGSVSNTVVRHARCSVEVVRIPPVPKRTRTPAGRPGKRIQRILLPIDDSRYSEAATQLLSEQFRPDTAEVKVVFVVEPPNPFVAREMGGFDQNLDEAWDAMTKQATILVAKVAEMLCSKGLRATGVVEQGDPKSRIIAVARDWRANLIVLGSHGRKGLEHFLLGSVSEAVARHAPCSVEVVRIPPGL
jgi:nucleotide-binding universal stress UspA family protein